MTAIGDGGPAFPRPVSEDRKDGDQPDGNRSVDAQQGMSLRDWFAGQALAGYMADPNVQFDEDGVMVLTAAKHCYALADAMLKEREKKESP